MTADAVAADTSEGETLYCYRHPDRETYVRCGRCDQPICTRCAMQGPVGFRCRSCGKPAIDPLTSLSPVQAAGGFGLAVGGGAVATAIGLQLGFFAIIIGFFAGGLIADLVMRFTGIKRGPRMAAVLLGGIAVGSLIGVGLSYGLFVVQMAPYVGEEGVDVSFVPYLAAEGLWAVIVAGAAMAGAWGRLRF